MAVELQVTLSAEVDGVGADVAGSRARDVVERAARATLRECGVEDGELSITILDDSAMADMNRQWKGREGATDVLAFALHARDEPLLGDVYVDLQRAAAQAMELNEPVARELARLTIHGTLHTLGWDHPEEGREESEMWETQERILEGLESLDGPASK